jgi:hypothetical protein
MLCNLDSVISLRSNSLHSRSLNLNFPITRALATFGLPLTAPSTPPLPRATLLAFVACAPMPLPLAIHRLLPLFLLLLRTIPPSAISNVLCILPLGARPAARRSTLLASAPGHLCLPAYYLPPLLLTLLLLTLLLINLLLLLPFSLPLALLLPLSLMFLPSCGAPSLPTATFPWITATTLMRVSFFSSNMVKQSATLLSLSPICEPTSISGIQLVTVLPSTRILLSTPMSTLQPIPPLFPSLNPTGIVFICWRQTHHSSF